MSDSVLFYSMRICLKTSLKLNIFFSSYGCNIDRTTSTSSRPQTGGGNNYRLQSEGLMMLLRLNPRKANIWINHSSSYHGSLKQFPCKPRPLWFYHCPFSTSTENFFFCNASSLVSDDMPILLQLILLCEWVTDATEYTNCSICIFVHLW